MSLLQSLNDEVKGVPALERTAGRLVAMRGPTLVARIPQCAVGDMCHVQGRHHVVPAMVVSVQEDLASLAPLCECAGIGPGAAVLNSRSGPQVRVGNASLGCVVDALGSVLQKTGPAREESHLHSVPLMANPPPPLSRGRITEILPTGIRSIDGFLTLGLGQRVALMAGAGVGKSTLLGMMCRNASVDVSVIALIGERGREVNEFIQESLGPEGLRQAVVVVSTSDEPPLRRYLAALTATAIAEYFRDQGKRVLLMIDSLTRVARAIRDMTLATGELPVRQGYTPSVYSLLPRLLERAGPGSHGSISALYTVLTNGERDIDPLAEEIKSLLDGHLVLEQSAALAGIRPAIDPLQSVSRLSRQLQTSEQQAATQHILALLQRLKRDKDILLLGGSPDEQLKRALQLEPEITKFRNQPPLQVSPQAETMAWLLRMAQHASGNEQGE